LTITFITINLLIIITYAFHNIYETNVIINYSFLISQIIFLFYIVFCLSIILNEKILNTGDPNDISNRKVARGMDSKFRFFMSEAFSFTINIDGSLIVLFLAFFITFNYAILFFALLTLYLLLNADNYLIRFNDAYSNILKMQLLDDEKRVEILQIILDSKDNIKNLDKLDGYETELIIEVKDKILSRKRKKWEK